jgi:hypothetical protein
MRPFQLSRRNDNGFYNAPPADVSGSQPVTPTTASACIWWAIDEIYVLP